VRSIVSFNRISREAAGWLSDAVVIELAAFGWHSFGLSGLFIGTPLGALESQVWARMDLLSV
jgi:predicted PurR-regulated permease PerM